MYLIVHREAIKTTATMWCAWLALVNGGWITIWIKWIYIMTSYDNNNGWKISETPNTTHSLHGNKNNSSNHDNNDKSNNLDENGNKNSYKNNNITITMKMINFR